jgi:hypothetical protein
MRRELVIAVVAMGVGSACKYNSPMTGDDDAMTIPVTAGFTSGTMLVDENSRQVNVPVALSSMATQTVSVQYAITGGTATLGADYTATSSGRIDFPPGQTMGGIQLMIINDGLEEPDETIELTLSNPSGVDLGTDMEVVTIAANILPRVSFTTDTMSGMENASVMIDVQLDKESEIPVSVEYTFAGTATQGADYTLMAGTITFPAHSTSQQLALGVVDDALNEDNETVAIALANPTNALLGAFPSITDTIIDDDAEPDVSISTPAMSIPESTATVNLTVTLSAPSGRMVTVPFSASPSSTATAPDDYTYMTASPLVFPAGMTTQTITIAVVNDTIDEPNETVITALGTPTNANLNGQTTHTLTITDDDQVCYGTGNAKVCLDTAPTTGVTLPATIDTTPNAAGSLCAATQPTGWTAGGQPQSCFIIGTTITQSGQTLVHGTRPLVLVGSDSITISALLDVASHRNISSGPGSPGTCKAFVGNPGNSSNGGGGGAGGSFMSGGGDGGKGDNGGVPAGGAATADATAPTVLRAGCDGQRGGSGGGSNQSGAVGHGGGVVYLVAGNAITITNMGIINASGSAGTGGAHLTGGSGAGSGGMIKLYANTIATGGAILFANGAGGASGGDGGNNGGSGVDPTSATTPAAGGTGGGANGGAGFANGTPAVSGSQGSNNNGGGAGGGGGGYVEANLPLNGATVSAGVIHAP